MRTTILDLEHLEPERLESPSYSTFSQEDAETWLAEPGLPTHTITNGTRDK